MQALLPFLHRLHYGANCNHARCKSTHYPKKTRSCLKVSYAYKYRVCRCPWPGCRRGSPCPRCDRLLRARPLRSRYVWCVSSGNSLVVSYSRYRNVGHRARMHHPGKMIVLPEFIVIHTNWGLQVGPRYSKSKIEEFWLSVQNLAGRVYFCDPFFEMFQSIDCT